MIRFADLIPENTAPEGIKKIGVYRESGLRVGGFSAGRLVFPDLGEKLYSFGVLSDLGFTGSGSVMGVMRAFAYLETMEKVNFICICGDLTQSNQTTQWTQYSNNVTQLSTNTPVYPVAGERDCYGSNMTSNKFAMYTKYGTFYTFEQSGDLFIMMSQNAWAEKKNGTEPFDSSSIQSLSQQLERNRNRRCFVFLHAGLSGGSGDPYGLCETNALWGVQGQRIREMMGHYSNALWFHGHSRQRFEVQSLHEKANYDFDQNCHSIHVPAFKATVDISNGTRVEIPNGSQGYVVDVYSNHVVLRGRDFTSGEFLPVASYCLDTSLREVDS